MMDAKKALVEVDGDMEKAMEVLRQKVLLLLIRKWEELLLKVELVLSLMTCGAMIEVNCETDFVAKNEEFIELN